jgi:hypothetical protein
MARSSHHWLEIINLQPDFWPFLPHMLKKLGFILQMEESKVTLPHLNARVFIAQFPEMDVPKRLALKLDESVFECEISLLGNQNACFHCKKNCSSLNSTFVRLKPFIQSIIVTNSTPKTYNQCA